VSGCHINDCHYINANHQTEKRVKKVWKKMERLGLDKNRLQLAWISAAEGLQFTRKIKELEEILRASRPPRSKTAVVCWSRQEGQEGRQRGAE